MKTVCGAATFLATFLVVYPLSIGPAFLLEFKLRPKELQVDHPPFVPPSRTFIVCYYPILWLMEKYPSIGFPVVDWYTRLWLSPLKRD